VGRPITDIAGQRFGMLTAISYEYLKGTSYYWKFKCDCGNEAIVSKNNATSGCTQSCGCLKKKAKKQSGIVGVTWDKNNSRWKVSITIRYNQITVFNTKNLDKAIAKKKEAEKIKEEIMAKGLTRSGSIEEFKQRIKNQKTADEQKKIERVGGTSMATETKKARSNYGEVTEMDRDNKMGFIIAEDKEKIFFVASEVKKGYNELTVGTNVVFIKKDGYNLPSATEIRVVAKPIEPKVPTPEEIFKKKALAIKGIYGIEPTDSEDPLLWEPDVNLPYGFPFITKDNGQFLVKYEEDNKGVLTKFITIPESFKNLDDAQKEFRLLCHYLKKDKTSEGYKQQKTNQYIEESKKKYTLNLFK